MWVSIIIMIIIIAVTMYPYIIRQRNKKHYQQFYSNVFLKKEMLRGDFESDVPLMMDSENLIKAGYPNYNSEGYSILVKEKDGVLHFNYDDSPQIELLSIEYKPKYQNVRSGNITKIGNNYINDTSSRRQEITSEGLLTFRRLDNNQKFRLRCSLNESIYMKLKSDFIKLN